jgi:hypothetical protein
MPGKSRKDRPKNPTERLWLVKFKDLPEPVEVPAEHRAMARHYAKSFVEAPPRSSARWYRAVEWCRLKREQTA